MSGTNGTVGSQTETEEALREDGPAAAALSLKHKMYNEANKVLQSRTEFRRLMGH